MTYSDDVLKLNPELAAQLKKRGPGKRAIKLDTTPPPPKPFPKRDTFTSSLFVSGLDRYCCPECERPVAGNTTWTHKDGAVGMVYCVSCNWRKVKPVK